MPFRQVSQDYETERFLIQLDEVHDIEAAN